jgi:membrane associated rhomboid family serine protease
MILIPLRSSERVYSTAKVTATLIAVNVAVFLYQVSLPPAEMNDLVTQWGIVPDRLQLASLVTSMFLHGGWLHILGNMLFLWVFGRNVEDLIGGTRYLGLYLTCGIIAGIVQVIFNPYSRVPTIGASGAIAGIMGAYLIKLPQTRINTLFFLIFVTTFEIPAPWLLLYWFAMQFFSGIGSLGSTDYSGGGVAWFAHVGGFLAGMLLVRFFPDRRKWRSWYEEG